MNFKKTLLCALACSLCATPLMADEAPETAAQKEDKLLPLMTMEQAFAKTLEKRQILNLVIRQLEQELQKADEKDKPELEKKLRERLNTYLLLQKYMDFIYGLGNSRSYEYNRVTSEIFLRVGTVTEVFNRALQRRDAFAKAIVETKAAMDKEQDETKKNELNSRLQFLSSQYAFTCNALYVVFQIHPARHYHFDPATSTLFLKTNDEEVARLQKQLQEARDAAAAKK